MAAGAAAADSEDADGVGVVDHEAGVVALADVDNRGQLGDVAAHAVDAVDDDEGCLALGHAPQGLLQVVGLVVAEAVDLAVGELGAVVDAGVVAFVDDGRGVAIDQGGDGAEVGLVAGGEDQRRLRVEEVGDLGFELEVDGGGAVHEPRAGHGRAVLLDGVAGGGDDAGVAGQPQVVVGPEHDDALAVDDGLGALVRVERLVEGVHAHGLGNLDQLEAARLGENVPAIGVVVSADVERIDVERGRNDVVVGDRLGLGSQRAFLSVPGRQAGYGWSRGTVERLVGGERGPPVTLAQAGPWAKYRVPCDILVVNKPGGRTRGD